MAENKETQELQLKPRGRGRPKKGEIVAKKPKHRGTLGRPAGDKAIMDEYKARMLASPKSARVLEKVFEVALEDGHPGQMAAMKLVLDRIVPASSFDHAKSANGGVPQISINISGLNAPVVEAQEDVVYDVSDVEAKYD